MIVMKKMKNRYNSGFTLIELVVIILILGIIAALAVRQFGNSIETARYEQTKTELDALAMAITGSIGVYGSGHQTSFGYVGDIGSLPPNLDALVSNPGGYTTWQGPYITRGNSQNGYKTDGWNSTYIYSDTMLRSTGSGSNIDKLFAISSSALLSNSIYGFVVDASRQPPGGTFIDSVLIRLTYPNGSGGLTNASSSLGPGGRFAFSNIPVGLHTLRVIYTPDSDTVVYSVTVRPNQDARLSINFPADLW